MNKKISFTAVFLVGHSYQTVSFDNNIKPVKGVIFL